MRSCLPPSIMMPGGAKFHKRESIMSLELLLKVLPPPIEPYGIDPGETWAKAEDELGIRLPSDYRQFVDRYGTGCIDGFLWVHSPLASIPGLNLIRRATRQLEARKPARFPSGP